MTARLTIKTVFILLFLLLSTILFTQIPHLYSQSATELAQQKFKKNQELQKIIEDINAISSSKASLSEKIKRLEEDKKQLDIAVKSIQDDLKIAEELTKEEEENFKKTSEQYAFNHALYYVESQKNFGVMIFESKNIHDLFDRMLYFSLQDRIISEQREYIKNKKLGIQNQKEQLSAEQLALQKSIDEVNKTISQLYIEQEQLNSKLRQASSSQNILSKDIANLSKQEKSILEKKAATANPPTNGTTTGNSGAGSGTGTTPPLVGTVISNSAIDVFVANSLVKSTDSAVRLKVQNSGNIEIWPTDNPYVYSRYYRGLLEFNKNYRMQVTDADTKAKKVTNVVNELSVEDYLLGLGEMPSSWGSNGGQEALKAQAIAGRTYAYRKMESYQGIGYDLLDLTNDQNYNGDSYGANWPSAVSSTINISVLVNGKPVETFYSSSSGGYGLSSQEVWGGYRAQTVGGSDRQEVATLWQDFGLNVPVTSTSYWRPGINDSYDNTVRYINAVLFLNLNIGVSSSAQRQMLTNGTDWKSYLGSNTAENTLGTLNELVHEYNTGGTTIAQNTKWTSQVKANGSNGNLVLNGTLFRTAYNLLSPGSNGLYSTLYDIKKVAGASEWQFYSRGYGHRVGMSQYGAYGRARAGQDYKTILKAYYTGIDVVQYNIGRNIRVGITKAGAQTSFMKSTQSIEIYEGATLVQTVSPNTTIKIVYK